MENALQKGIFRQNALSPGKGPVIYWMIRDQRIRDNRALLFAQQEAVLGSVPLVILFCLSPSFLGATLRQYDFMLRGLKEVDRSSSGLNIPFFIRTGDPAESVVRFSEEIGAGSVITDFSPLRIHADWKQRAAGALRVPLWEADAHNVVPCRLVSTKQEWAARTIRPKIRRMAGEYLHEFPPLIRHPWPFAGNVPGIRWDLLTDSLDIDRSVPPVTWLKPGESAAQEHMARFIATGLDRYAADKNDPSLDGLSGLSPYLHFGQISAQRVALEVGKTGAGESAGAFLEELIVRKELSDNFCLYNPDYDRYQGIPAWAKRTLEKHWNDSRSHIYPLEVFESASTHDPLWNAAQQEMVRTGKMHGYMRMYWAKKILEWSRNPEEAFHIAVSLNDRFSLDGRDPNGYAGIAWSIGGVHDRPWKERPVFGTIRYMSYEGCRRKFDVGRFIGKWAG
jgi:deoxyribodipyrimidine photo-lyase